VFESAPQKSKAAVIHGSSAEADESQPSVFESQPQKSKAEVSHGTAASNLVEVQPAVFESKPVVSKAHAKAGTDGAAASESEYETDDEA